MAIPRKVSNYQWTWAAMLSVFMFTTPFSASLAEEFGADAFRTHMQPMLTANDEWRTPNPDYEEGKQLPLEYALQLRLQPDGQHVLGELMGIYEDDRRVTYWSLIAMYNPVTHKVVTQQIGWDGTLLYGENAPQQGQEATIDMIEYNVNGTTKIVRHTNRHTGKEIHDSDVYERGEDGEWALLASWTWRRVATAVQIPTEGAGTAGAIAEHAGYLVSGNGQWRAPNPDYSVGGGEAKTYGMNFRWGQRKRYIVGEIVSIADDGSVSKEWSIYVTYNPITGRAHLYQTGTSGVYFRGELGASADGRYSQTGLVFLPNGAVKSVRDEVTVLDEHTQRSDVYERDEEGGWMKVREWTWVQATDPGSS